MPWRKALERNEASQTFILKTPCTRTAGPCLRKTESEELIIISRWLDSLKSMTCQIINASWLDDLKMLHHVAFANYLANRR